MLDDYLKAHFAKGSTLARERIAVGQKWPAGYVLMQTRDRKLYWLNEYNESSEPIATQDARLIRRMAIRHTSTKKVLAWDGKSERYYITANTGHRISKSINNGRVLYTAWPPDCKPDTHPLCTSESLNDAKRMCVRDAQKNVIDTSSHVNQSPHIH
jgi:hypothetical protein